MKGKGEETRSKRTTETALRRQGSHTGSETPTRPLSVLVSRYHVSFLPSLVGIAAQPCSFLPCQQKTLPWSVGKGSQPMTLGGLKHRVEVEPLQEDSPREGSGLRRRHPCLRPFARRIATFWPRAFKSKLTLSMLSPHHGHQLPYDIPIFCDILTWLSI